MSVCDYKTMPRKIEPQVTPFTFHDSINEPGDGEKLTVGSHRTLTIEITGDCTSREVKFYAVTQDEKKIVLEGINSSNHMFGASTLGINEIWEFDIAGKTAVLLEVTKINGGSITIKGNAVT
ncbi:lysozyme [Bacillus swezeyi]|uniref:lysozyme n=1 Tax=Bacillus swezeyi TaxID=1925020 RepID=UPI002E1C6522|nr:lysozyme [Bacillus swezeyi]MED2979706.1 lysozyme [Bacillus swezeyi]